VVAALSRVPVDLEAGSATVSNLGAFGIRAGTPVLSPPEALLVFVGALEGPASLT
jgi:pyruvate/2-oxoglutarate dehydrogenase complex dihydrolipoamide acyltransferase (E2) component